MLHLIDTLKLGERDDVWMFKRVATALGMNFDMFNNNIQEKIIDKYLKLYETGTKSAYLTKMLKDNAKQHGINEHNGESKIKKFIKSAVAKEDGAILYDFIIGIEGWSSLRNYIHGELEELSRANSPQFVRTLEDEPRLQKFTPAH